MSYDRANPTGGRAAARHDLAAVFARLRLRGGVGMVALVMFVAVCVVDAVDASKGSGLPAWKAILLGAVEGLQALIIGVAQAAALWPAPVAAWSP